jgi:hypothetical protein
LSNGDWGDEKCINVSGCIAESKLPKFPEIKNPIQYILPPLNHDKVNLKE